MEGRAIPRDERTAVAKIARAGRGGLISVADAAKALGVAPHDAAVRLGRLARRGWLRRARRGLYLVLALEVEPNRPTTAEDPWLLAQKAFSPCYVGGWSAAEHWGLTEQLFRSTLVVTGAAVRHRSITLLGHEFRLFRVPKSRVTGVVAIWRGRDRVHVSDRERTLVDCLRDPELAGGIRHLADMMREYATWPEHDFKRLASIARQFGSGAAWKRLGYLAERVWTDERSLLAEAQKRITAGYVRLDPGVRRRGTMMRRWRLRLNVTVSTSEL